MVTGSVSKVELEWDDPGSSPWPQHSPAVPGGAARQAVRHLWWAARHGA